jgi:hypothetical protein
LTWTALASTTVTHSVVDIDRIDVYFHPLETVLRD